jgi:Cu/Ag efflux protein CusF
LNRGIVAAVFGLVFAASAVYGHDGRATVNGVVTEVDQAAGTITLDHDEIPNLQMAAMTMVYRVKDPAILKGLKPGDKVKFEAEELNGQPSVVEIQKEK